MMPAARNSSVATAADYPMRALPALPTLRLHSPCAPERFVGGQEPSLDELLGDPIVARLLASDRIMMGELLDLVSDVREALKRR
jgi:hypothetical protein